MIELLKKWIVPVGFFLGGVLFIVLGCIGISQVKRFPQTDARSGEAVKFRVACSRLPEKDLSFSVTAISCWGRRSVPLTLQV